MKEHTRVARARRGIERRLFLKAVGLGLSAPIAWQLCHSAVAQAQGARPKRLMIFYMPHGVPPEHFNPVFNPATPNEFSLNQSGVSILGSLEPYKQYVSVLQGFSYPGASTHQGILTMLSNFGDGRTVDDTTPRTTFEHVIANGLGARPLLLGAIPHRPCGIDTDGKLMWDGQYVVPEKNPLVAFDRTFGATTSSSGGAADVNVQLRNALTQLTEGQLGALRSELNGLTTAQSKLQIHLDSIQSLRIGAGAGQQSCDSVPSLPALDLIRQQSAGQPLEGDPCGGFFLDEANFPAIVDAQLQLAAQALVCNATPVVAVQMMYTNADINFAFMGSPGSHHATLSHTGPGSTGSGLSLETRVPFANAQKWFMDKLVTNVVAALNVPDPADPGRLVIDNTLIYCCGEIGEGAWHTSRTGKINFDNVTPPAPFSYMPITLIGGGGGAIKTGQVLRVNNDPAPDANNAANTKDRPAGDIYLALSRAMGVEVASFGNATNTLTEILA
jgi:Protein of unknown function (DUF1552)